MEKNKKSWGWIIFWLIIFWPVGIYLVIKRFNNDKSALMSRKKPSLSAIGLIMICIGAMGAIIMIGEPEMHGAAFFYLSVVLGGSFLLHKSRTVKSTENKYKRYIEIVVNQNLRSIDDIAAFVDLPYDIVVRDLQEMINKGYLKDALINQGGREIILKEYCEDDLLGGEGSFNKAEVSKTAVNCHGCGANYIAVTGRVSECEYCGNAVNT